MTANNSRISFFVHPIPALAVAILALNDHFLKGYLGNWLTGKLSDFAGLFFFPLFAVVIYILLGKLFGREWRLTKVNILIAIVVTDLIFVAIKVSPEAAAFYISAHRLLGVNSAVTQDISDLLALSISPFTYAHARGYF